MPTGPRLQLQAMVDTHNRASGRNKHPQSKRFRSHDVYDGS